MFNIEVFNRGTMDRIPSDLKWLNEHWVASIREHEAEFDWGALPDEETTQIIGFGDDPVPKSKDRVYAIGYMRRGVFKDALAAVGFAESTVFDTNRRIKGEHGFDDKHEETRTLYGWLGLEIFNDEWVRVDVSEARWDDYWRDVLREAKHESMYRPIKWLIVANITEFNEMPQNEEQTHRYETLFENETVNNELKRGRLFHNEPRAHMYSMYIPEF